jgi:hypothetical protein
MNTNSSTDRQWTIRFIPWLVIVIAIVLGVPMIWLLSSDQSCGAIIGLLVLIAVVLAFGEITTCQLDQDRRMVTIRRAGIFRRTQKEFSYEDVHTVSVQKASSTDADGPTYRLVFVLKSGDSIPLTSYTSSGKSGKEKLANKITDYMNRVRSAPITEALNGVVRVEKEGITDGVRWQIDFVMNNDQVPLTRWHTTDANFLGGFLLIVPAAGAKTGAMPGGLFGTAVRFFYGQYLRVLDLGEQDLPGFDKAEVLPGNQFGLERYFSILTSNSVVAKNWLDAGRAHQLAAWCKTNPLKAGSAAANPHIILTVHGLWLVYRGRFNQEQQIAEIARLGAALTKPEPL